MTPKQFVVKFVGGYLFVLVLIGIFNRIVDPSWYYRDIEINGFNAIKPEFISFERDVKPALLIRDQPEAVVFGSSYAEIGFDPTNPAFTDYGRLKGMNFAFAKASWERVLCSFEFAVAHAPIKRALVGFHPGSLPMANCAKDFASMGQLNALDLLLTKSALEFSVKTIRGQNTDKITHTKEGLFYYNRWNQAMVPFRADMENRATTCKAAQDSNTSASSALDLSGMRHMLKLAKEHGVELVFYTYPKHAFLMELDKQCGGQEAEWQAMKQISAFIEAESAGKVRAWQFYKYNYITAEPVRSTKGSWQDAKHFNFEAGNMMLEEMFDINRGRTTLAQPLGTDYRDFLLQRAEYLQDHPEFQTDMQNVYNSR